MEHAISQIDSPTVSAAELGDVPPRYAPPLAVMRPAKVATVGKVASAVPPPAREMVSFLSTTLYTSYVEPAVRAQSGEEYVEALRRHWHEFHETLHALHVVVARMLSEEKAVLLSETSFAEMVQELANAVVPLAGEQAAEEMDFAVSTYQRAVRIVSQFQTLGSPSNVAEDRKLCRDFSLNASLHFFGLFSVMAAASADIACSPEVISKAFEITRGGALHAYVAAREALQLRISQDIEDESELFSSSFDEDDRKLADAGLADARRLLRRAKD